MFNQIFSKKVIVPFFQFLGVIAIFEWIVFPGLTAADTIVNVFSVIIAYFTLLGLYYMVKSWFTSNEPIELTKEQSEKIVSDIKDKGLYTEPKKKTAPKSKPKTEKVLGEFQINNKEKVRKSTIKKTK